MRYLKRVLAASRRTPLFVYQTLKSEHLRKHLLKEDVRFVPATLEGYRNVDKGDGYHTLVPSPGDSTKGEILYLTEEELKILDKWESRYERREITLFGGQKAWVVYLLND
jgi:gamma-glutamylcyclotransferase (GGCT)/AIG2-like uncharacterized protein YtfP